MPTCVCIPSGLLPRTCSTYHFRPFSAGVPFPTTLFTENPLAPPARTPAKLSASEHLSAIQYTFAIQRPRLEPHPRGLVQSVFSPPPRLATSPLDLNMIRRVAGLKTLRYAVHRISEHMRSERICGVNGHRHGDLRVLLASPPIRHDRLRIFFPVGQGPERVIGSDSRLGHEACKWTSRKKLKFLKR